jgi:hypothetical protein
MAEAHLNSLSRFEVYRSLSGLNRSFHLIVQRLQGLENKNIFDPAKLTERRRFYGEVTVVLRNAYGGPTAVNLLTNSIWE